MYFLRRRKGRKKRLRGGDSVGRGCQSSISKDQRGKSRLTVFHTHALFRATKTEILLSNREKESDRVVLFSNKYVMKVPCSHQESTSYLSEPRRSQLNCAWVCWSICSSLLQSQLSAALHRTISLALWPIVHWRWRPGSNSRGGAGALKNLETRRWIWWRLIRP